MCPTTYNVGKTIWRCLVWSDPSKIKNDMDRGNEIIVFGYIMVMLHDSGPKSFPFLKSLSISMIGYLFLRFLRLEI